MARGGHGLPKILLGPAMPYLNMSVRQPPLKQRYSRFRGGRPQGGWPVAVFYPLGHPRPYASGWEPELIRGLGVNSMIRGTMLKKNITNL
jgi:hypothetical protein